MLDPGWPAAAAGEEARLTMVDFASELFGLSTLWLGAAFFRKHTDYFGEATAELVEEA